MQIDFHHGVTYVLARLAGFDSNSAQIIAHSSQFVDDAVHDGAVSFSNESIYRFQPSAHKMLDYRNFRKLANHLVWIPFHFLPGGQVDEKLKQSHQIPGFVQKIICRPNSLIAQRMVEDCIDDQNSDHSLYRLGITMHVYADTWAHQGFAGITHRVNTVEEIFDDNGESARAMNEAVQSYFEKSLWEKVRDWFLSKIISDVSPIGHGAVLSYPDRPYLNWQYKDWKGDMITRNNPKDYMDACDHVFLALTRFLSKDPALNQAKIAPKDRMAIEDMILNTRDENGEVRHQIWMQAIADGKFSFGKENVSYIGSGEKGWLAQALPPLTDESDVTECTNSEPLPFCKEFLQSHWKRFHDALRVHRSKVMHNILPEFQIMAE